MNLKQLQNLDNVSIDMDAEHKKGERARDIFCENWANSKKGLELVYAMVKNPIVKMVVTIVIAVGDGIEGKICPKKK